MATTFYCCPDPSLCTSRAFTGNPTSCTRWCHALFALKVIHAHFPSQQHALDLDVSHVSSESRMTDEYGIHTVTPDHMYP